MIDITNLTSLITAFRNETEQGSISPETVGSLLQAIANLLSAATTEQEQSKLTNIYNNLLKMGNCLTNLAQGDADRNNVLADYAFFNPISGLHSAQRSQVFIKQATTERAGAMRAQQVIDLNATKKGVAALEDAVAQINTQLEELNSYIESTDGVVQSLADDMYNAKSNLNTLNNRVSVVPIPRGRITIDPSSITSPAGNYFKYSMADGHYDLVRGGMLIGRAVSYQYGNFRMFDVVGLCHINSNSFVYQDTLAHILVRVAQNGLIVTNGTIDHVDLQNQINELKFKERPFSQSDGSNTISGNCVVHGSLCTIVGRAYIDADNASISALLPVAAADEKNLPEAFIYYEDTMQWVRVYLFTDVTGTHISATIPEDFMNGGEVNVSFSISFMIKA
ncbi:MAG: hypothetical protein IJE18_08360 [Bacteroidaceae bacterium]|nr:hypothetical protein [Bacteroidaceae bacterium]